VALKPGGYHIMLLDLKQALGEGRHIPLTLTFAKAGSIDVEVDVKKKSGEQNNGMTGMDHDMH
jgi:periplasmic copper chaperone A